ncbi:MAG: Uma2 family endonuclease [Segetibacter sp.]|nr:Uma2 family endonuclease [Segetibacter sp.]
MQQVTDTDKRYSLEEYIKLDETGMLRHEFYDGKLFAMPGETLLHNEICIRLLMVLTTILKPAGWKSYIESVKVKIENEDIYVYPDIVVMKPGEETANKSYIINKPVLIAEILSDSTRKYDSTDKFIQYQKISSLRYYLLVEPEKHVVIFYEKDEAGEWSGKTFTEMNEVIALPFFDAQLTLADIYL